MASVINSMRIETLSRDNYDTWCIQAEALLIKNDTWGYVSGEKPKPEITGEGAERIASQAAYDRWVIEDRNAKSDIILSINPAELKNICNCQTSREVWMKLESVYASKGLARKATLIKQLKQSKMLEDEDIRTHLMKFYGAVDKLNAMNVEINGDLLTIILLYSLSSSFENFRCAIETRDQLPDAESLKVKIIEEYKSRKQKAKENNSNVMFLKQSYRKPINTNNRTNVKSQSESSGSQVIMSQDILIYHIINISQDINVANATR